MISLFKHLRSIHPLSESLRDRLEDLLKEKQLARKDYLLKAGQTNTNIYFVERGLLRSHYFKGGKEISSGFMKEGDVCVAAESFFTQRPGMQNIQALEDTVVYYLSYDELQRIYKDFPEFSFIGRVLLQKCLLSVTQRIIAMWMQKAEDRYAWLIKNHQELMQRVPAKYLASYLGITEGMLSKLKSRKG